MAFQTFYISIVLYNASLTATKITFLLQYYRILGTGQMRKVIIIAFVFVGLWSISQLLVVIFTCTPIHKFWLSDTPGTCIPNLPFWYINAAGNIVTDVTVFVLPLPALGRLKLRKGQKIGLIFVFCLGFFVSLASFMAYFMLSWRRLDLLLTRSPDQTCAISVIRIQYLKLSNDVTWDNVASACWSIGELGSGITCACLPTLRPFFSGWLPGMRSQGGPSDNKYYKHSASGRDVSNASRLKSTDENGSSRGIIYPEDLELQSDDGSDKGIRVAVDRHGGALAGSSAPRNGRMDRLRLGLKPTVHTEIKVGSPGPKPSSWQSVDRGIEVKRDFTMTTGQ